MIYFDNSATSMPKPKSVAQAVAYAIDNFGNASRSFNDCALLASQEIHNTREEIANLVNLDNCLNVAFTSSATESLNMIINGLFDENDHVITSLFEHNSVLRPLYNIKVDLSFLPIKNDDLDYQKLPSLIKENTKAIICTHASNVTGLIIDVDKIKAFAKKYDIIFILDVSQSLGSIKVDKSMADIICFTGHKSLFGPQGTGGIIYNNNVALKKIIKTGGAGSATFDKIQALQMPDIFEVGTLNSHSIYGLQAGVKFINDIGIEKIIKHKFELVNYFLIELAKISGIKVYGKPQKQSVGVVSINYLDVDSSIFAYDLYQHSKIATRSGFHCAPLIHQAYHTQNQGMVRFSFSYFNNINEIDICIKAIKEVILKY